MTVCYFYSMVLSVLISAKANGRFKIPNLEVMTDWAGWVIRDVRSPDDILETCVDGSVSDFEAEWPDFMQHVLHPKLFAKDRGADSRKTSENVYHVVLFALMQSLGAKGWEVSVEAGAGGDYVDLRLVHKLKRKAVLIELISSEKEGDMERDANRALKQIAVDKNYRNSGLEGLPADPIFSKRAISSLREYGIACCHLDSYVKGQYLELNTNTQNQ